MFNLISIQIYTFEIYLVIKIPEQQFRLGVLQY